MTQNTNLSSRTTSSLWWLTAATFFGFFVFGFTDNLKGPSLPELLDDLAINYSTGGTILLGSYIGFMVASFFTGLLAEARGVKNVLGLAAVMLLIGVGGFSFAGSAVVLTLFMFFQGFGMGALELGCNALIIQLHPTNKGRYLNLLTVMHGLGATLAPLYAGRLLANGTSWRLVFRWDVALVILLTLFVALLRFPGRSAPESKSLKLRELRGIAFSRTQLLFYGTMIGYVAVEVGIGAWLVEYLQQVHQFGVRESSWALSIFFGLIIVGRLAGSLLVDRIGYLRAVVLAMGCASLSIGIGLFLPQAFWMLPLSGLFLSLIFPTVTAALSNIFTNNLNAILGLLFTFSGIGAIFGPWMVGLVADRAGIQSGFSLILIFAVLTWLCVLRLARDLKGLGQAS